MRDFLDSILDFIGTDSLTDEEYDLDAIQAIETQTYDVASYNGLASLLDFRESISTTRDKLKAYYAAKGVSVTQPEVAKSNIYIGSALCGD